MLIKINLKVDFIYSYCDMGILMYISLGYYFDDSNADVFLFVTLSSNVVKSKD